MNVERLFPLPMEKHVLRHFPVYGDYRKYKPWLRDEYEFRCVFCKFREKWYQDGAAAFHIDHLTPKSVAPARAADYANLAYCCPRCNRVKSTRTLPGPCEEAYGRHYEFDDDGKAIALTRLGTDIIDITGMNRENAIQYRKQMLDTMVILVKQAARPDAKAMELLKRWLGYPDDLPDLREQRVERNSRPEGAATCFYVKRHNGELAEIY